MKYEIGDYEFKIEKFLPLNIFNKITEVRVNSPWVIKEESEERKLRKSLTYDGKLTILAADHPARMVLKSGDNPLLMGNRHQYLGRVLRVITSMEFDGVMGTPDILEDLLIVNFLVKQKGGKSFLDEKVMIGCTNRGGLSGAVFEMDDRMTAYTVESIKQMRLDGAKMMFRLDLQDERSGRTIEYCAKVINQLNRYDIPVFLEALYLEKSEGGYKTKKDKDSLIKVVQVASGLGDSSRNTWLKIPYTENFDEVARATTLPILMLGGESLNDPTPIIHQFYKGMRAGGNVRGALVGRNITFPGKDDPRAVALAVNSIVHKEYTVEKAIDLLMNTRDQEIDGLTKILM